MNRNNYIYQLAGRITDKKAKKKKDGTTFYQLATVIPDQEQVKKINVFADSCKKQEIWQEIEASNYIKKEFLFYCKNYMGSYFLVDWQELEIKENHGSN